MNLGELWEWDKRKLGCRIREESGNPAADEIREQLSRLTGVEYQKRADAEDSGMEKKALRGKRGAKRLEKEERGPPTLRPLSVSMGACHRGPQHSEPESRRGFPQRRSFASAASLAAYADEQAAKSEAMPETRRNIRKKYFNVPRNPPTKVLRDVQRDRLLLALPAEHRERELRRAHEAKETHVGLGSKRNTSIEPVTRASTPSSRGNTQRQASRDGTQRPQSRGSERDDAAARGLPRKKNEQPFKSYSGDLFGTRGEYMNGIIYQSRFDPSEADIASPRPKGVYRILSPFFRELDQAADAARASLPDKLQPDHNPGGGGAGSLGDGGLDEHHMGRNTLCHNEAGEKGNNQQRALALEENRTPEDPASVEAKLHCAKSLAAWSAHVENVPRLAEEGAVAAALVLSKEPDPRIRRSCAQAFKNMSRHPALCEQLVEQAAVPAVSELGVSSDDPAASRDCALALVNLTLVAGVEETLVEDGIVIALVSLMNQREDLADACARGLFNLTCVDAPYQHVERVIKAFISLASSTLASVKHVCAAALCNLSDVKPLRARVVEEGLVQVVGVLARGAESRTRRVCAIVLHLVASTRPCRPDMVSKGAVQVLYALSSDIDTMTLHYVASALIQLAMEEQNLARLVHEGGVTALCNICLRCPHDAATTQLCASALSLLSRQALGRQAIVQEGCVPALVTLLHEATDETTIRNGLSALTNLLMDETNHEQVLAQGGINAVLGLQAHESCEIRRACALALFNFSRGESSRDAAVSAAAVPAIIALSHLPEPQTRMRCAATLCKLASVEQNVSVMIEADVVPAFIDMLQTRDRDIVKHCCAALCRLAHEGTSAVTIAEGAVPHVIAGCGAESDAATRRSCCAVLSAVSAHEPCRVPLCKMGVLRALTALATDRAADDTTRLRCAVALANLSNEPSVRGEMVEAGVVPVLASLSNSYCEENQLYCARALCNLGCNPGSEDAVVEQGGVAALMMIAMVRAVSHFTKQVCANALLNLISPEHVRRRWLERLARDGLVQAVSVLSRLDEEETMHVCAKIFCILSGEGAVGRALLADRRRTLEDVFGLMRSREQHTRIICGKTTCNLLGALDSQAKAVKAGAVPVLSALCALGDAEAEAAAANAFFLVSGHDSCRAEMLDAGVLPVLITSATSPHAASRHSCVQVLSHLAWWPGLRAPLLEAGLAPTLVRLVGDACAQVDFAPDTSRLGSLPDLVLHALVYLTFAPLEQRATLVERDVVPALADLYGRLSTGAAPAYAARVRGFVAVALRSLVDADDAALDKFVADGAVRLACDLLAHRADDDRPGEPGEADSGQSSRDATVLSEHCAATLCIIARKRRFAAALMEQGVLTALPRLGSAPSCFALAAATVHVLALDPPRRDSIALSAEVRDLVVRIVEAPEAPHFASTLQSCAQTLFWLSRCVGDARDSLTAAGVVPLLVRLSRASDESVATACSEALKNLASGGGGGIEEGTVATLIAMTLHTGAATSNVAAAAAVFPPVRLSEVVQGRYAPTDDLLPETALRAFETYAVSTGKIPGGTAGAGPPPPEPPEMDVQDTLDVTEFDGSAEAVLDDEDNTVASMMFAKMSVDDLDSPDDL